MQESQWTSRLKSQVTKVARWLLENTNKYVSHDLSYNNENLNSKIMIKYYGQRKTDVKKKQIEILGVKNVKLKTLIIDFIKS